MTLNDRIAKLYLDGLTYQEIMAELRVNFATVNGRIRRMRSRGVDLPYRVNSRWKEAKSMLKHNEAAGRL